MKSNIFKDKLDRLYIAVVTPLKEKDLSVDEEALRKFLQYCLKPEFIEAGVGIIINPEAGEIFYLSREEKNRNIEIAIEECGGKVPVFAGVIDNKTEDTISVAKDAKKLGVNGIFVMPPLGAMDVTSAWNAVKYPEVMVDMIKAIDKAVNLPIIVHPTATFSPAYGVGLPLEVTKMMIEEIPNIIGWKMTYNYEGYRTMARYFRSLDRHVAVLGAPAIFFHENLSTGQFDGTVTGSFCYAMESMLEHIKAWDNMDINKSREIWESGLAQLQEYVYSEYSRLHIKYKTATWLRGLIPNPWMRPPLPKPKVEEIQTLYKLLKNCKLNVITKTEVDKVINKITNK